MKYIKNYNSFINESEAVKINLFRDYQFSSLAGIQFLTSIAKYLKDNKILKYYTEAWNFNYDRYSSHDYRPKWGLDYSQFDSKSRHNYQHGGIIGITPSGEYLDMNILKDSSDPQGNIKQFSLKPRDVEIVFLNEDNNEIPIDTINQFPDEIIGTYKLYKYSFKKGKIGKNENGNKILTYYLTFTSENQITFDDAKHTTEMKEFLDKYPVEIISNTKQIKNGTFIFAIPKSHVVDVKNLYTRDNEKYVKTAFALYATGYIRKTPLWAEREYGSMQAANIGSFDSVTLEGWKTGIKIIDKKYGEFLETMKKNDVKVLISPEERHDYRGYISGHKFGI